MNGMDRLVKELEGLLNDRIVCRNILRSTTAAVVVAVIAGIFARRMALHNVIILHILPILANGQYCRNVAAAIAVVGRTPHRHQILVGKVVFSSLHYQLMRPRNEIQLVDI